MSNDTFSEEEFAEFLFEVRLTAVRELAELRSIDRTMLPADLREVFDRQIEGWLQIFAMTEPEAIAEHLIASEELGRQLTPDESRALLVKH